MRRHHLTHHQLSEKNWSVKLAVCIKKYVTMNILINVVCIRYHFAARSWEMTKKSALLSEYNRLLP